MTYDFDLFAVLGLGDLGSPLAVEVGVFDFGLQVLELVALRADHLDFALALLVAHLEASHLAGEVLLHLGGVDPTLGVGLARVEMGVLERSCHNDNCLN